MLRGTARPCRLVSPVPGTRVPRTGSGNQGSGQGSGNPGFREPGFGARFQEPKGSANQTFKQGSGNNGFWLPFGFRDVKVPGRFRAHLAFDKVPGTLPWFRAARAWIVPKFWNHRNTNFETSCKPEFGEPGFWHGSSNTGFRQGSENHHRCGPTVWIYFLDYATGSGQGQGQSSGKVPRFGKQPRGRIYAVGCTKVHATDRVPENQFARKPRFQDQKGPVNEQSLTGGGQRDNKSARLGSGNPGFQYTLWVAPRFRKRGFQEDKVPGTQGSRNTRDSGNPPANLGCFVAPH